MDFNNFTSNEIFGISILAFIIWLAIMYFIIQGAVKSALASTDNSLKGLLRARLKEMIKEGYSKEELQKMMLDSSAEFWAGL